MKEDKKLSEEEKRLETEKQIRIIHRLAERLPWIAVIVIALVMILTLIEALSG